MIAETYSWGVIKGVIGIIIRFGDNAFNTVVIISKSMTPRPGTQGWSPSFLRYCRTFEMIKRIELKILNLGCVQNEYLVRKLTQQFWMGRSGVFLLTIKIWLCQL